MKLLNVLTKNTICILAIYLTLSINSSTTNSIASNKQSKLKTEPQTIGDNSNNNNQLSNVWLNFNKLQSNNDDYDDNNINNKQKSTIQQQQKSNSLDINYETHWFEQKVDHFTWTETKTYKQRYLVNKQHWCGKNCPILFYTGNEGDIEQFANNTGFMWENAGKLSAMLVFAEHRYYGQSMPIKINPSEVSPNQAIKLRYLSSEQAMADFASLIFAIKNKLYNAEYSPVIVIGGSYGGMLSAWMRMKYPQLVAGALAGSAPIFQFPNSNYNCQSFNKIVTTDYENYSPNCSKSIAQSWPALRSLAKSFDGLQTIRNAFNICPSDDFNNTDNDVETFNSSNAEEEVETLINLLNEIWVNMAMTDYANKANFLSDLPALPIKHACSHLTLDPFSIDKTLLIKQISLASQVYTNYTQKLECLKLKTGTPLSIIDVLWDFQTCTEMIMPICSNGVDDMFEPQAFDVGTFVENCQQQWNVSTQVNRVKIEYGLEPSLPSASNIIFSYCTRDPWSAGCPTQSYPERGIHAIKIENVCHHEDLRESGPNDGPEVKAAREQEVNIITDWIQKHYTDVKQLLGNDTLEPQPSTQLDETTNTISNSLNLNSTTESAHDTNEDDDDAQIADDGDDKDDDDE